MNRAARDRIARNDTWHPRGEPTWPDWKKAKPGQRFEHVRTGQRGTFVAVSRNRHNGAVVDWDARHDWQKGPKRAYVVAPAFDLRPVEAVLIPNGKEHDDY